MLLVNVHQEYQYSFAAGFFQIFSFTFFLDKKSNKIPIAIGTRRFDAEHCLKLKFS